MPDGLYERDILSWSGHQADLPRRLARGERVNDVDWLSRLNAVRRYLRLMLVHLLKVQGWPNSQAVGHWRQEIMSFQADAEKRFSPSMRQSIDLAALYGRAMRQIGDIRIDGEAAIARQAVYPASLATFFAATWTCWRRGSRRMRPSGG